MSCDRHGAPCDPLSPVGPCSIIQWLPWSFSFLCSCFLFVDQSCSSLEGFPYSRLFLTRIPVPAHSMLPVFCSLSLRQLKRILRRLGLKRRPPAMNRRCAHTKYAHVHENVPFMTSLEISSLEMYIIELG